ncbi:LacI family DNA-binding transcriptional regulator [Bifidobacterium sp. MA2]|uniref:LacI family DNA-binding transcriptional regulator n=1 Tax=Bifidobacterium santillanense TaxID=2809028 RepID=A0ABS5UPG9_9BIFI|nr:LacI family DNA-binding transcriptional regulator [Bifidobacterium santillanense]MBT1172772.1 LacI family DNA-binding transcriptional regulator [Bifidobacterium santillanense]
MVTLDDVAARAGVSRMTASNAIRGKSVVKASTARRVLEAAAELGYKPNLAARQLSSGRTHIIGMSVADLDLPFPAALAASLSDEAFRRGYQLITQQTRMSSDYEQAMLNSASTRICDGTIVCWPSSDVGGTDALVGFAATHPVVVLDGHGLEGRVDTVFTPNREGARAAVSHLIAQGARRILVLGAPYRSPQELERLALLLKGDGSLVESDAHAGAEAGEDVRAQAEARPGNGVLRLLGAWEAIRDARAAGVDVAYGPGNVCPAGWDFHGGYEAMSRILAASGRSPDTPDTKAAGSGSAGSSGSPDPSFDAVFALADAMAIGALKALLAAGVRVPEKVMVIGFDGVDGGGYTDPGLSSVAIDTKEIARVGLDLLIARIEAGLSTGERTHASPRSATTPAGAPRTHVLSFRLAHRGSAER